MTDLLSRRLIDTAKDEISCTIARSELQRAWQLYHNLADMVEINDWDEDTTAYWQAAIDESYEWCRSAQNLEQGMMQSYRPAHGTDETGCAEDGYFSDYEVIGEF